MKTTMEIGAHIDVQMKRMKTAMAKISSLSAWYTSSALTGALTQRPLQAALLLFCGFQLYVLVENLRGLHKIGMSDGKYFRFTSTKLRGGGAPTVGPGVDEWGLLLNGCEVDKSLYNVSTSLATVTFSFANRQAMNGWWLRTSLNDQDQDVEEFTVDASDDGKQWRLAGGSKPIQDPLKLLLVVAPWDPTPTQRLVTQYFDRQVAWQNQIYMYGDCISLTLGCFFIVVFAANGYEERAKLCGALTLISSGTCGLVSAVSYVAWGHSWESLDAWLRSPIVIVCGFSLAYGEKHIVLNMLTFGGWLTVLPWIVSSVYTRNPAGGMNKLPFTGIIILAFGVFISISRRYVLLQPRGPSRLTLRPTTRPGKLY
jgi:hypothetical protein